MLVPALVSFFGRWNWWIPEPLARVLRVARPNGNELATDGVVAMSTTAAD
jgi:putative drug exporter of the RND superfamily